MVTVGQPGVERSQVCRCADSRTGWTKQQRIFLESFPLFAVLVLVAHVTHHHSLLTLRGAHLYFWARLGYLLAAVAGYSLVRSVLFWNTAVTGILLFLIALLW